MTPKIPPSRRWIQNYLVVIPPLLIALFFYAWLSSSGSRDQGGTTTHYYASLAEAIQNGNLYLATQPDPRLLALENPYNLQARIELARSGVEIPVDYSLYAGKFYLYWGPVPALLLAVLQPFLHQQPIGDFFLAFAFGVGILLIQSLLLLAIWDRHFSNLPRWIPQLSILAGWLVLPMILLRHEGDHARVYEAAIAAGQFFLMGGLLMAFSAMDRIPVSNRRLAAAGFFWVLAIGSRHLLIAPIGFMVALATFWIMKTNIGFMTKIAKLISLYLPLVLGGIGLAWYNWARFGSITETGFSYALAGVDLQEHAAELFSGSYILQNLYNYFLHPPGVTSTFPFVGILKGSENPILTLYVLPQFYYAQQLTGLFYLFPFAIFACVPLIVVLRDLLNRNRAEDLPEVNGHRSLAWIVLSLSGSILLAFFLLMIFFWAGIRYMGDFIPSLAVLSALGFWQGYQLLDDKPIVKNLFIVFGITLATISLLISVLLAISTNAGLIDLIIHSFPF